MSKPIILSVIGALILIGCNKPQQDDALVASQSDSYAQFYNDSEIGYDPNVVDVAPATGQGTWETAAQPSPDIGTAGRIR